jgi:phosphatidylinositol alpha-1,6-mannosyltransferase
MRLLALTHSLSEIDGVGRYAVSILKEAERFSDRIEVFLSRKHRGISGDFPAAIAVTPVLPPDYFMYMSPPRFFYFLLRCMPGLVRAAKRADLVHCLCDYPFSLFAWWAGRAAKRPVVVSGHGTYSVAPFRYPMHRRLIRRSYGGADAVLFGSDFARGKFEEKLRLPNVRVLDYGVDVSLYDGEAPPPPARVEPPYVLCVGELKERKGYEISLPAFAGAAKRDPRLTFAVVGRYVEDDPYLRGLKDLLKREGVEDRVVFLGNVTEEEKHALYAHCEVFMLTPKESVEGGFEALGLVFLEAGACRAPVIGSLNSGAVCAIRDGENGFLIPPDRPDKGSEAILRIVGDPDLKRRLGERGREMALAREWKQVGRKLEAIYADLLAATS